MDSMPDDLLELILSYLHPVYDELVSTFSSSEIMEAITGHSWHSFMRLTKFTHPRFSAELQSCAASGAFGVGDPRLP
jgi:hypothetical protein